MRMIDADALFAEIKERHDMFKDCTYIGDKARRDELGAFMADIVNAPTIGGWISVEDEQPKTTGFYVTWCRSDLNKDGFYRVSEYSAEEHGWYDFISHDFNDSTTKYWMPIPKAPKEDEE